MNTLTRRQREFLQREQLFLDTARSCLRSEGIANLTMDRIADLTEYAKGTVYKHFTCKEDILCALCADSMLQMGELFEHAARFDGNSREKMMAVGGAYQLFTGKFPEEFDLLIATRTNNLRQKAAPERVAKLNTSDEKVHAAMRSLVGSALAANDLVLQDGMHVDEICFGLWSMSFGMLVLDQAKDAVSELNLRPIEQLMFNQMTFLLDGYGWQPLSSQHDYLQSFNRILKHLETKF